MMPATIAAAQLTAAAAALEQAQRDLLAVGRREAARTAGQAASRALDHAAEHRRAVLERHVREARA